MGRWPSNARSSDSGNDELQPFRSAANGRGLVPTVVVNKRRGERRETRWQMRQMPATPTAHSAETTAGI
jgi:hypothetical protein